ncbi:hypothetical protein [Amycolatopsis sp. NPDC098790]|uniref:hypothetical protein n=1 Tax=Amycolatopsis sp. NPDC098790 TaxID=3363939 RepID=UPI00380BC249
MTLPVVAKLTGAERELVDAARSGLAYVTDTPVRAAVLRELLLGLRGPVDPRGVRVGGARIAGTLNLDHVEAPVGLQLVDCVVVNTISARAATLPWLDLSGSRIAGVDGTGVRIGHDLDLTGVRATGSGDFGVICLRDARVDGLAVFARAEIRSGDGPALYLDDLECRALKGAGLRATGIGAGGAVRLLGARVSGEVFFGEAALTNESGPVVFADGAVAEEDFSLTGATVTGAGEDGALRLLGARIGGQLDLGDATLVNDSGPAVGADRLRAGGLYGTGVTVTGAVSLLGARIDGQVNLGGAVLANPRGRALSADSARIEGSVHARGLRASGTVSLQAAHVHGDLYLGGAELADDTGPALSGDRLRVDGSLRLAGLTAIGSIRLAGARVLGHADFEGVTVTSSGGPALLAGGTHIGDTLDLTGARLTGAVQLYRAEVGGQVLFRDTEVTTGPGSALDADDTRIGTELDLTGAKVTSSSEAGAVSLRGARIDGPCTLDGAVVTNDAGPAVVADRCWVRENWEATGLKATGAGAVAAVRLLGAHVGGRLAFTGAEIGAAGTHVSLDAAVVDGPVFVPAGLGRVELDGFRFGSLGDVTWREWLLLVRDHTAAYRPGPYQQLAASERAAGHDGNARQILIAQQRDLQRRAPKAIGGWPARRFHWLWGFLAGYGYRARRTAAALLLAVVAAGGLGLWAGHVGSGGHRAAERTADLTAATGTPCTTVELVGVGLDRGLPLSPGVRGRCDLNTGIAAGQWFTVAIWLVQAAIWALATLALVGYTGLVRKTG